MMFTYTENETKQLNMLIQFLRWLNSPNGSLPDVYYNRWLGRYRDISSEEIQDMKTSCMYGESI